MSNDNDTITITGDDADGKRQVFYKGAQVGKTQLMLAHAQRLALGIKLMTLSEKLRAQDARARRFSIVTPDGLRWRPGTARHVAYALEIAYAHT